MASIIYNHKDLIKTTQPSPNKAIYPGMVIRFNYRAKNISDKTPMVLVLWNDSYEDKIHGLNLNYLPSQKLKRLFDKLQEGAKIYGKKSSNTLTVEDQDDDTDYDDNLPYRNLLKKPYTRIKLPTYRENRGGNPLSKAEAIKQMDVLYEKVVKRFMSNRYQVYRTYKYKSMRELKVLNLKLGKIY